MRRLLSTLFLGLALPVLAWAQQTADDAPVVAAPKIVEALSAKDIVRDQSGRGRAPRGPSIDLQVQFDFDSAQLLPQGMRQLDQLALALNHKALLRAGFQLAGHTDRVGDAAYNLQLSRDRADAVKAYLETVHQISPARLQAIGYGYTRLADRAHPEAAINRRVEVRRVAFITQSEPDYPATSGGRLVPTPY